MSTSSEDEDCGYKHRDSCRERSSLRESEDGRYARWLFQRAHDMRREERMNERWLEMRRRSAEIHRIAWNHHNDDEIDVTDDDFSPIHPLHASWAVKLPGSDPIARTLTYAIYQECHYAEVSTTVGDNTDRVIVADGDHRIFPDHVQVFRLSQFMKDYPAIADRCQFWQHRAASVIQRAYRRARVRAALRKLRPAIMHWAYRPGGPGERLSRKRFEQQQE